MLGKLYKHEFKSLARSLWPVYLALLVLAVFNRISMLFDVEDVWPLNNLQVMLGATYGLSIVAVFIVSLVIVVVRFYQHLMTSQGYLSFTLPVTATQHIVCKLVCGTVATIVSAVATLLSAAVLTIGTDALPQFFKGMGYLISEFAKYTSPAYTGLVIAGIVVGILLWTIASLLMFYTSISIGQQFKNRIGGAVLSFIAIYMVLQIVGIFTALPLVFNFVNGAGYTTSVTAAMVMTNGFDFFSLMLGYIVISGLVLCTAYFLVTRHLLTKKLNLE